jgi:hypothetical protein
MPRCADCGFLAKRHLQTDAMEAADNRLRTTGVPNYTDRFEKIPLCFVQAADLESESGKGDERSVLAVITKDRDCSAHLPWQPGLTPKEHEAKMERRWQLEFERKTLTEDRAWREQVRKDDLEWKAQQDDMVRKQFAETMRQNFRTFWIIGIVGIVVMAAVQVLCALIQAGLGGK